MEKGLNQGLTRLFFNEPGNKLPGYSQSSIRDSDAADISCQRKLRIARRFNSGQGYTLLEIIVVITLFGLITGITVPRLNNLYNSFQWANERDDILHRIGMLGYSAFQEKRDFELRDYPASDAALPLELPKGWRIKADPPIHYKSNGVCLGGKLQLTHGETRMLFYLAPPHCSPSEF